MQDFIASKRSSLVVPNTTLEKKFTEEEYARLRTIEEFTLEDYRYMIEEARNKEEEVSKIIEILDEYKRDVHYLKTLVDKYRNDERKSNYIKQLEEVRQGDIDYLETLIDNKLEDVETYLALGKKYIPESKALRLLIEFKRFKEWVKRNIGPTVSIGVTVVGTVVSVTIYVLEFLEDSKHKIDNIRKSLKDIIKDMTNAKKGLEQIDADTFRKTMYQIVDTSLDGLGHVLDFIKDHIEVVLLVVAGGISYTIYKNKSYQRKIHHHLQKNIGKELRKRAKKKLQEKIEEHF